MTADIETDGMHGDRGRRSARMPKRSNSLPPRQRAHVQPGVRLKITVIMVERHVAYLDLVSILIRLRTQKALARTELLQAFVEFMKRSGIDFSRFATADEITRYLVVHFRARMRDRMPLLLESSLFRQREVATPQEAENVAAT